MTISSDSGTPFKTLVEDVVDTFSCTRAVAESNVKASLDLNFPGKYQNLGPDTVIDTVDASTVMQDIILAFNHAGQVRDAVEIRDEYTDKIAESGGGFID